eukprot:scaffold10348_cov63-Phaeocystis_antarctica.AAC.5
MALLLLHTRCVTCPTRSKHCYTMALLGLCYYYSLGAQPALHDRGDLRPGCRTSGAAKGGAP